MSNTLQVLFLHDINNQNKDIVIQNFESFKKYNVDIQPIHDEDLKGLPNSFPVPLKSFIPRGSRRWSTETVLLNYILINEKKLKHDYYMFCEWDCYCNCDLNNFIKNYIEYDICAPHVVSYQNEPGWHWFKSLHNVKDQIHTKKIGFRPSVFILFKKRPLIGLAKIYIKLWDYISNLNSEVRLGLISNLMKFKIGEYKNMTNSVEWYESVFQKNSEILHPVKNIINDKYFLDTPINYPSFLIGDWDFGKINPKETKFLGKIYLNENGSITNYNNFNEKFWNFKNDNLIFYNQKGGVTTIFRKKNDNFFIGDYYNGEVFFKSRLLKKSQHILYR